MPGLITHYLCGQGTLQILPKEIAKDIEQHRKLYNIGCQGPDIFFYYVPAALKKSLRGIGSKMHKENVGDFMRAMAEGLMDLPPDKRAAAFAYFSGYLTHYALDCATHPYVYYKSGFRRKGERGSRLKFSAYHFRFESAIDTLMLLMVAGKKPRDEKLWRLINVDKKETKEVADFIGRSISTAYGINIFGKNVLNAMGHMAFVTRMMQSNKGLRKRVLAVGEHVFFRAAVASSLIHLQEIADGIDYLNEGKQAWKDPWDDASVHLESFVELLEVARDEGAQLIEMLWEYMEGRAPLADFLAKAGDRSFATGRPISEQLVFTVHDVVYRR